MERRGNAYIGTSGFAYTDWAPLFYPAGTRSNALLPAYAERLNAVELNNTFYQHPKPERIAAWRAQTPDDFRFAVKAQRGGSMRLFGAAAHDTVAWLSAPYRLFGHQLGSVLYRVPEQVARDDGRLAMMLDAWPREVPLTVEFQHSSWHVDEVFDLLRAHRVTLCATDLDDRDLPDLLRTGDHIYLRMRRTSYSQDDLHAWADRLDAFLADGVDCYVFLRHDEAGESALRAIRLRDLLRT